MAEEVHKFGDTQILSQRLKLFQCGALAGYQQVNSFVFTLRVEDVDCPDQDVVFFGGHEP